MLLRLQRYNFTLKYKPEKELIVADMLSRAYTPDTNSSTEEDVMKHVDTVVNNIPVAGNRVQDIKFARIFVGYKTLFLMGGLTTNPWYQPKSQEAQNGQLIYLLILFWVQQPGSYCNG